MDSTVLKVLTEVSKKQGVPFNRLKELWLFNNRAIYRTIKDCATPEAKTKEVKIPYIGTITFNNERYDKIQEKVNEFKAGECESRPDLLGDDALHREDNL